MAGVPKVERETVWNLVIGKSQVSLAVEDKRKLLIEWWRKDPWNYLTGEDLEEREIMPGSKVYGRELIWTSAENDPKAPLKPFPRKEYLRRYVRCLHCEKEVLVDKARQMYCTTCTLLYIMWDCQFGFNRRWVWTKNTQTESEHHLRDKVRKVYERLPQWVKHELPMKPEPMSEIYFPKTNSYIIAGAENVADREARGGTATGFGIDEAVLLNNFAATWAAAAPMTSKLFAMTTPRLNGVSAAAFYEMLEHKEARFLEAQG